MKPSLSLDHTVVTCGGENDHKHTDADFSRTKLTEVLSFGNLVYSNSKEPAKSNLLI